MLGEGRERSSNRARSEAQHEESSAGVDGAQALPSARQQLIEAAVGMGLYPRELDALNVQGVLAKNLKSTITMPSATALLTSTVIRYRSTTKRGENGKDMTRVAVAMVMDNPGTAPWTARDAALLVGKGHDVKEAKVWQLAPIPPGGADLIMVETELQAHEAWGTFTLKLWDENGGRLVTLGGVTFP